MLFKRHWERLKTTWCRPSMFRHLTITKALLVAIVLTVISLIFLSYHLMMLKSTYRRPNPPQPVVTCHLNRLQQSLFMPKDHSSHASVRIGRRVLVLVESQYTKLAKQIAGVLESARFEYKVENMGRNLPMLTHNDKGRFGVIIFESLEAYINMDHWNRQLIDKYCRDYSVGMIIFVHSVNEYAVEKEKVPGFPLVLRYNMALKDYRLNVFTDLWRMTRPGEIIGGDLSEDNWTVFEYNHSAYEPLAYANASPPPYVDPNFVLDNKTLVPVLQDRGTFDGIPRIFFGNDLQFWLHKLVLLDALSYLSHGKLSLSLDRYIQIDVDDIFVGITGTRMVVSDVEVGILTMFNNDCRLCYIRYFAQFLWSYSLCIHCSNFMTSYFFNKELPTFCRAFDKLKF